MYSTTCQAVKRHGLCKVYKLTSDAYASERMFGRKRVCTYAKCAAAALAARAEEPPAVRWGDSHAHVSTVCLRRSWTLTTPSCVHCVPAQILDLDHSLLEQVFPQHVLQVGEMHVHVRLPVAYAALWCVCMHI